MPRVGARYRPQRPGVHARARFATCIAAAAAHDDAGARSARLRSCYPSPQQAAVVARPAHRRIASTPAHVGPPVRAASPLELQDSATPTTTARGQHPRHLPALDGVRGLAILSVIGHHTVETVGGTGAASILAQRIAGSMWAGVDLFFVLSGFLITGVLLETRGRPHYFRNFVARRALRILPLYAVVLVVVLLVLPAFGVYAPERVATMRANVGWFVAMLSNVLVAIGDWEATADLGHLWSICIEEQFYLVWPVVAALLAPPRLRVVAAAIFFVSPLLRLAASMAGASPAAVYTLMPTRLDGLAVGAAIAVTLRSHPDVPRLRRLADGAAALALLPLAVIFTVQGTIAWAFRTTQLAGFGAWAVLGGWLVLRAATSTPRDRAYGLLASPLLRTFGKYSYSLYLFHLPVIAVLEHVGVSDAVAALFGGATLAALIVRGTVVTLVSLLVAVTTWYLIERPALELKRHFSG